MKASLKWLRVYTPANLPPEALAHRLTMAGAEVAEIERYGENWNDVYVGEITGLHRHPNADRLQLVDVNYGPGRTIQVVTGATNIAVGDKVPLALVGARLLDTHASPPEIRELKPVKLRGIISEGMVCSARELGLGEDHAGILILDSSAVTGTPLSEELGDVIFDLDVTPNRVDLFSMLGVAREVATLLDEPLQIPSLNYPEAGPPVGSLVEVEIVEPELAPRYMAAVIQGVKVGESPKWLKERLAAAGLRPINNVVDVTNYVMLELGQPLHAFDYDKLRGHRIIVRPAKEGETITLLDGSERVLNPTNLVIADAEGAVAVAGVMGGANSEVSAKTHDILIESANFNPLSVRRTARALRQLTDAAHRFERGLPRQLPEHALKRAVGLILETAGGTAATGLVDVYPLPMSLPEIYLTPAEVKRILGIDLTREQIAAIFTRARCLVAPEGEGLKIVPPMQRTDLQIPADLCEEIARIIGYDAIPATLPGGRPPEPTVNAEWQWKNALRQTLVGLGLDEVVTYALTSRERMNRLRPRGRVAPDGGAIAPVQPATNSSPAELGQAVADRFAPLDVEPVEVLNPLSRDSEVMRLTSFSNLLETVSANLRVADDNVLLFEMGRTYIPRPRNLPEERKVLTVAAGAYRSSPAWGQRVENDFFWLKGIAEATLDRLGVANRIYRPIRQSIFHPTRSAAILAPGQPDRLLGVLGEVEPGVRAAFDIDQPAFLFALDLDAAIPLATAARQYVPIPRFPPIVQDLAVIVPASVSSEQIEQLIRQVGAPLVKSVALFDIYQGPPIPAGRINLAYHITYQAPDRTLTNEEVAAVQRQIEQALVAQLNAELRG